MQSQHQPGKILFEEMKSTGSLCFVFLYLLSYPWSILICIPLDPSFFLIPNLFITSPLDKRERASFVWICFLLCRVRRVRRKIASHTGGIWETSLDLFKSLYSTQRILVFLSEPSPWTADFHWDN